MKKYLHSTLAGMTVSALVAHATLLVDVDNTTYNVAGDTVTFQASEAGGGMPNVGGRYVSVETIDTDIVATLGTDPGKVDFYLQWNDIAGSALDAGTYKYAEFSYTLAEDYVAGIHKMRLGDTVTVTGSSGANDHFSNPELLDTASAMAAGSHSFIVDLTADVTYDGDWTYIRWNMYNTADNGGKGFTLDQITYATAITAVPEPTSAGLLGLGVFLGFVLRRRR